MASKLISWGIIGAGNIAHKFAADLQMVDGCNLIAIASRSRSKAEQFASVFDIPKVFDTYKALFEDDEVHALYIATPHSYHFEHSLLALNNKKAVLCEKPFAMDLKQVDEMIICAKANNVLLMEAMWTAFLPHFNFVQELLARKTLGEVLSLEADFGFYTPFDSRSRVFDKSVGGGSLLDIGIYPVFLALSALGDPESVHAHAHFFKNGADCECFIQFNYKSQTAVLKSSLLTELKTAAIFSCEKGQLIINPRFHEPTSVTLIDDNQKQRTINFKDKSLGYRYEIEHFNRLLREDKKESSIMTFERSRQLIHHLDLIRERIGLEYA